MTNVLNTVSYLLCLQELLTPVFIGLQVLLMGENDLFSAFYKRVKAICAVQRLQKAAFGLILPIILAARLMDTGASSSCIDSVCELAESGPDCCRSSITARRKTQVGAWASIQTLLQTRLPTG